MKVRVYQPADGPARVVHPAWDTFNPLLEPEAFFYARVMARTEAADPDLVGLPYADLEHTDLPTERTREVKGVTVDVRQSWRLDADAVSIDEAAVAVDVEAAAQAAVVEDVRVRP